MTSLAEALRVHGPKFLAELPHPLSDSLVQIARVINLIPLCRTGELGGVRYQCDGCNREHWVGRSCGNRHCASCGHEKSQQWIDKQRKKRLPVTHFLVTFTVPRELALVLRGRQRDGYRCLFDASSQSLRDVGSATKSLKGCQLGFFGVLHTWGRDLQTYHPHIHYVVPGGGVQVDEQGRALHWQSTPENFLFHHSTIARVYQAKLADALREADLYDQVPAHVWQQKFVVDIQPVGDGQATVNYLAAYVQRVAISDKRIVAVDSHHVTYTVTPSKTKKSIQHTISGDKFVKAFAQHILPKGFQKIRYYGWMSPNSRVSWEEVKLLLWLYLGWTYWLASGHAPQEKPRSAQPHCSHCGGRLRVVEIKYDPLYLPRPPPKILFKQEAP